MNLKILFVLMMYYSILGIFFINASSINDSSEYNVTITLNETDISTEETDTGGLFSTGVSFGRFFAFVGFGVGLPDNTPSWFKLIFGVWQTIVTIFVLGFIISSIWDG